MKRCFTKANEEESQVKNYRIVAINLGSTSTKLCYYEDEGA